MKLLGKDEAEKIIVYGKDKGFSMYGTKDNTIINVYHRIYNNKTYDIAVIDLYDKESKQEYSYFYLLEVKERESNKNGTIS